MMDTQTVYTYTWHKKKNAVASIAVGMLVVLVQLYDAIK